MVASGGPGDSIDFLVFVKANSMIGIGASYDFTLSEIKERSKGSHEVVVGIMLNNRHRIVCPQNMW